MNTRRVAAGLVLGLALVSSFTWAQPGGAPKSGGKPPHMALMDDKLGLTDEQVQKMREIRDNGGSMADMRAVLTPEQQGKATQMMKENKGDRAERKAQMQESLGLSDEQKAKMAQIRKDGGSRKDVRALLTPEQQKKFDAMRSEQGWKGHSPEKAPAP